MGYMGTPVRVITIPKPIKAPDFSQPVKEPAKIEQEREKVPVRAA